MLPLQISWPATAYPARLENCFLRIRQGVSFRHLMMDRTPAPWSRRLIILLCCSLLAGPSFCWAKSDLDRFELSGAVRTMVTKHPQLTTTHIFDRNGQLIQFQLAPTTEAEAAKYLITHDDAGRVVEEKTIDSTGATTSKKIFRYVIDAQGRETAQVAATETGGLAHVEFAFYDKGGQLVEDLAITGQGVAEKSLYDVRGNLVYHARYFQGHLVLEATHHHGPLGRLKESRFYGAEGDLMRKDFYRYDQTGRRIEQTSEFYRQSHLRRSLITYDYDQVGNWIKETIQRWSDKNGAVTLTETVVSRERAITYHDVVVR